MANGQVSGDCGHPAQDCIDSDNGRCRAILPLSKEVRNCLWKFNVIEVGAN